MDNTIKLADIITVAAVLLGPIIAVQLTQWLDRSRAAKERKTRIFKNLMSTRGANMASVHVESLNMIDVEFSARIPSEKEVIAAWKMYLDHLNDHNYPRDAWGARRVELFTDLLYRMGLSLGYDFDRSHIKNTSYYPQGYGEMENEQATIRKALMGLLTNEISLPIHIRTTDVTVTKDASPA